MMTSRADAQKIITFDAPNSGQSANQGTEATGINLEGTITGNVTDNNFGTHGFVRTPNGRFTNFDAPGADPIVGCTCPNSINDLGVIAGNTIDTNGVNHGFVRSPDGQFWIFDDSETPAPSAAGQGTIPVGITVLGVIGGNFVDGNYVSHGFVRTSRGEITTFDPQGSTYTSVWSINNFGQIAGVFYDANNVGHGFVRTSRGEITTFDPPGAVGGDAGTYNAFVNDFGVIAGSYYAAKNDAEFGYLRWFAGQFTKFEAPKSTPAAFFGTELAAINPRLLAFLTHDRVSLAGTMIAVGVLYLQLSLNAIRYGLHWARLTILCSSFAGFASFFLFLGFGYLEPFHTFVTVVLFQFLLFALYSNLGEPVILKPPNLREDWRWRANQWGQFLFVLHGVILLVAGLTISYVGITQVFVHEDLEFMHTTAAELATASPRLLPLIAHDRATFGGMLIATGITVLLPALWGFRQGDAWLWWGLLGGGGAAYAAAIGVHLVVGYTNWLHLLPAFGGAALLAVGLLLSYPYLCGEPQQKRPPLVA